MTRRSAVLVGLVVVNALLLLMSNARPLPAEQTPNRRGYCALCAVGSEAYWCCVLGGTQCNAAWECSS